MSVTLPPAVEALPQPPSIDDPDNFDPKMDALLNALPNWTGQLTALGENCHSNAASAAESAETAENAATLSAQKAALAQTVAATSVAAVDLVATSTSSVTMGGGIISLVVQPGKQFKPNMPARLAVTVSPGVFMDGYIRSYDPSTGAVSFQSQQRQGSGTYSAWTLMIIGPISLGAFGGGGSSSLYAGVSGDVAIPASANKLQRASVSSGGAFVLDDPVNCPDGYYLFEFSNEPDDVNVGDLTIKDVNGNHLGYLAPHRSTPVHLKNSVDGWLLPGASPIGKPLRYTTTASARISGTAGTFVRVVPLDADRTLFLIHGTSLHAIIYQASTNQWGALTLLRSSWGGTGAIDNVLPLKIDTDKVLVASCPENSTSLQMVVLTIADFTITPGAAQTSGAPNSAARLLDLFAVGSSYVLVYVNSAGRAYMQARVVSGTTVTTFTAEVAGPAGSVIVPVALPGPSTTYGLLTSTASVLTITPYTVSGSTITAGAAITNSVSSATGIWARYGQGGRWLLTMTMASTTPSSRVVAVSFSGGTISMTSTVITSASLSTITGIQVQQYGYDMQVATTGTDAAGGFLTEFAAVQDTGTGTPTLVGSTITRASPAAQTVAPAGTNYTGGAGGVIANWMISTSKTLELHSFVDVGVAFATYRSYRLGPMNYSAAVPASPNNPKLALSNSVLHKPGSLSFAAIGDGSKPTLVGRAGNHLATPTVSPPLITDPANGCKGADDGSVWLAYSMGPDAVLNLEQVRIA